LPAADRGYATFGSFNNLAKITPAVAQVWAEILRRVPQSRLVLKYKGLGDEPVRQRYLGLFAACGVEPGRLELLPPSPFQEYLAAYGRIDVALDTFPFSGGATTCEALWMGVPVVTCPGQTFASRHASSHLASLGRAELIAGDLEQYVATAAELAGDLPRLAAIRGALRDQMAGAPLCDAERFAGDFTALMGRVWKA
jgi:predicted O-linked N-acetylglucosamine transferase (SPINDLY family)